MTTVFSSVGELLAAEPGPLGAADWFEITQERIDQFAQATGDDQWIHCDPERAASGPFGRTIAHGYLTLSLTVKDLPDIVRVENTSMGINYGVNKVRFPSPVKVGSRVRMVGQLDEVTAVTGGVQAVITVTVEIEGSDKPGCVVESISRFYA